MVSALLSDMYQITMAYAYWKVHKYNGNYGQLCAKMIIFGHRAV
jgi:GDP-D-mannose dehydratase